jgi:DNA-binding IclR family transcriptional regulator
MGSAVAALNIAAPAFRTRESDLQRFVALVRDASKQISTGLGC